MQLFNLNGSTALVGNPVLGAWLEKRTPAGRRKNIEKLTGACILLSSDAASFKNDQTLFVYGGIAAYV